MFKIEQQLFSSEMANLLNESGLKTDDVTAQTVFFAAHRNTELLGVIAFELYADIGFLRSLAVKASHRSEGVAYALVKHLEQCVYQKNVNQLYLLTDTAAQFFERLGYVRLQRELAPLAVQNTAQFRSLCPASAVLMLKS